MAGPIKIAILTDAAKAKAGFDQVSSDAKGMASKVSTESGKAKKSLDEISESSDQVATKAGTASGAFGALGSGLQLAGIQAGPLPAILTAGQLATDALSGASDFLTLALESSAVAKAKDAVKTVASTVAQKGAAAASKAWALAQEGLNLVMEANPIALVVLAVIALIAIFVVAYKKSDTFRDIVNAAFHAVLAVAKAVWTGIKTAAEDAFNFIKGFITGVINAVKTVIKGISSTAKAVFNDVKAFVKDPVGAMKSAFVNAVNAIKTKLAEIKDKAKAILHDVAAIFSPSALIEAGRKLIAGLVNGIKSAMGDAINAVKSGLGKIKNLLPGSPIKEGPLKSWNNGGAGKRLIGLLTLGINQGAPGLATAVSGALSGATSASGINLSGQGGASTGAAIVVNFNGVVGDPAEAGRQVINAINTYQTRNGRPKVA